MDTHNRTHSLLNSDIRLVNINLPMKRPPKYNARYPMQGMIPSRLSLRKSPEKFFTILSVFHNPGPAHDFETLNLSMDEGTCTENVS